MIHMASEKVKRRDELCEESGVVGSLLSQSRAYQLAQILCLPQADSEGHKTITERP